MNAIEDVELVMFQSPVKLSGEYVSQTMSNERRRISVQGDAVVVKDGASVIIVPLSNVKMIQPRAKTEKK